MKMRVYRWRRAVLATLLAAGLLNGGVALATQPNPEHKVTICHAKPPDTAANGYNSITVDVASVGYQHSGHEDQHDADVIPPYSYTGADGTVFTYSGKGDQAILANGCKAVSPSPTPSPSPSPEPSESPSPEPEPSESPSPSEGIIPPITGSHPESPDGPDALPVTGPTARVVTVSIAALLLLALAAGLIYLGRTPKERG